MTVPRHTLGCTHPDRLLRVPGQFSSIQRAVSAARPGDTVLVEQGVYQEGVYVHPSKRGLLLEARGKVILDVRPGGVPGAGPGIWIEAQHVTVRGFTIRNARRIHPEHLLPGCGVFSIGDDTVLERLTVTDCADGGLLLSGRRSRVRRCSVMAARGRARPAAAIS